MTGINMDLSYTGALIILAVLVAFLVGITTPIAGAIWILLYWANSRLKAFTWSRITAGSAGLAGIVLAALVVWWAFTGAVTDGIYTQPRGSGFQGGPLGEAVRQNRDLAENVGLALVVVFVWLLIYVGVGLILVRREKKQTSKNHAAAWFS